MHSTEKSFVWSSVRALAIDAEIRWSERGSATAEMGVGGSAKRFRDEGMGLGVTTGISKKH